jgi:HEAT repeat protein
VLAGDTWPELRRAATAALGARCPRPGPTRMLEGAADRDADPDVRGDALAALVGCKAPGVATRLLAVARDDRAPTPLRLRVVDLIGALEDRAQVGPLLALFADWRRAATSEDAALGLAVRAAVVLGRLGDIAVVPALLDAAGDAAFPELQAAAATGLGELGAGCPPSARATLDDLARSEERSVALAAKRARALCGRGRP